MTNSSRHRRERGQAVYAAEFLEGYINKVKCQWCQDPSRELYRARLCRHCYGISRRLAKAEKTMLAAKSSPMHVSHSHIIWLDLQVKTAQKMVDLAKADGLRYGAIHERQVTGLDLEHQFSLLSQRFLRKDFFYGQANLFDWSFSADQKRLIFYLLAQLHREFNRRHRKGVAQRFLEKHL
jgi:hypothetical protein